MDFFNGRVVELRLERPREVVPMGVSIPESIGVLVVIDPVDFSMVGPPVTGLFKEVGGGEHHHEGRDSSELVTEHLKVGVAVSEESFHVIVIALEGFGSLHEDWFDPQEGGLVVGVPVADRSLSGWRPAWWAWDGVSVQIRMIGQPPGSSSLLSSLP